MKVKEFINWKRVVFSDRVILKDDLSHMSAAQKEDFLNTEVITAVGSPDKGYTTLYVN